MFNTDDRHESFLLCLAMLALAYGVSLVRWRQRSCGRPLPPGPKSLPLIGNISHMRKSEIWKAHRELCAQYGKSILANSGSELLTCWGSQRGHRSPEGVRPECRHPRKPSGDLRSAGQTLSSGKTARHNEFSFSAIAKLLHIMAHLA